MNILFINAFTLTGAKKEVHSDSPLCWLPGLDLHVENVKFMAKSCEASTLGRDVRFLEWACKKPKEMQVLKKIVWFFFMLPPLRTKVILDWPCLSLQGSQHSSFLLVLGLFLIRRPFLSLFLLYILSWWHIWSFNLVDIRSKDSRVHWAVWRKCLLWTVGICGIQARSPWSIWTPWESLHTWVFEIMWQTSWERKEWQWLWPCDSYFLGVCTYLPWLEL